jgi:hypothetical protein
MIVSAAVWDNIGIGAINFGFVAVLGGAAGFAWGAVRHRRELDLAALADFRDAYGKCCAVWRAWSALLDTTPEGGQRLRPSAAAHRPELIQRAADVEGVFDALLVKIATERRLSDDEIRRLGRFREGYQRLRESIEKSRPVPFRVQYQREEAMAYVAFKALSVEFAALLSQPMRRSTHQPGNVRRFVAARRHSCK